MRLQGRVAIITGAASGIGRATALQFRSMRALLLWSPILIELAAMPARKRLALPVAVPYSSRPMSAEERDLRRMVGAAVETYGGLDILHNNAFWNAPGAAQDITEADWQATLAVTLTAVWQGSKLAIPHLMESRCGVILNTASVHSIVGLAGSAAYQAAKGGVLSLTRAMSLELAPRVRVVAILPGAIETPATMDVPPDAHAEFVNQVPLARMGQADEIASVAAFLASDEASYITGAGIVVDGGYTTR